MKKLLSLTAIAALAAMVSCGPSQEEIDAKNQWTKDSLAKDSIAKADAQKKWDDSVAAAAQMKADWDKRVADSTRIADSLANLKGGKKK